jgi:hypothetical protein
MERVSSAKEGLFAIRAGVYLRNVGRIAVVRKRRRGCGREWKSIRRAAEGILGMKLGRNSFFFAHTQNFPIKIKSGCAAVCPGSKSYKFSKQTGRKAI